jgi:hypothetical protein
MRPKKKGFLLNLVLAREYHHRVLVLPIVMTMMNIYRLLISFLAFVVVGIDIHSLFFVMLVETPLLSTLANCYRSSSGTHSHLEETYKIHTIQFDMIPCVDTL